MVVDPSKASSRWALPILKVTPGQRFRVVLGAGQWWFFGSHWVERQFLCTGTVCEGCVWGQPRVMGYRVAFLLGSQKARTVLLEAPLPSVARFESLAGMDGLSSGAGAEADLSRRHARAGVCLEPVAVEPNALGARLTDVQTIGAVGVLFNLPTIEEGEAPRDWAARVENVAYSRLVAAITRQK